MNVRKLVVNISLFLVISIFLASIFERRPEGSFLNTVFTVSGIMFSIGMGVLCTLNPDKVKNDSYYNAIKENVLSVRNSYLVYFFIISMMYVIYQLYPTTSFVTRIKNVEIIFNPAFATALLNILGIMYFITNFMEIQKLGFEISDRTRGSS